MATIRDVAKRSQVSPSTVSRFVNGKIRVEETTAARIQGAIRDLGYRPHRVAKHLATGKAEALGLVVPSITNPFFAVLAEAVETEAYGAGYSVLLCNTHYDRDREETYVSFLENTLADGLLYVGMHAQNDRLLGVLGRHLPVVIVDEWVEGLPPVHTVFVDNYSGGLVATQHLLQLGHRRIAFLGGPEGLMTVMERFRGYKESLSQADIPLDPAIIRFGSYTEDFGEVAFPHLMHRPDPPTAIVAANDLIAVGLMRSASRLGVEIPDHLSIVGFDDIPYAESIRLTTVRQPVQELGRKAARLLLEVLGADKPMMPRSITLPVSLIVRESSGPPRRP
jgi:LacI family transcriptional regulator